MRHSISLQNIEAIAIGAFDGMHLAHQELFKRLGENGAIVVIDKGSASLTPGRFRCRYSCYPCCFLPLSQIRHLDAEGFVTLLKQKFKNLKKIVVGYDFAFGKDRKYNPNDLKQLFNGEVVVVDEVKIDNISVHSRVIKELLKNGDIKKANRLLGRFYEIEGIRVRGQGVGKERLVPTINIEAQDFLLPKEGVYATFTKIGDFVYKSVSFVGHRMSTDGRFAVETHILEDFCEDERVSIAFIDFIRENRKFESLESLKKAIQQDIEDAKALLKEKTCEFWDF